MKQYPHVKDSGVQWLGDVPAHWQVAQYKQLVDIQNGSDHKHVEAEEGFPVIGSGGVFAFASDYLYDGESVLLGRKGTIDKPLYVTGKFWAVDTMYWTKIASDAYGKFAYYAALNIPFEHYSTNTALPSMTKRALSSHAVARPPLHEQVVIATFLDRETSKIDNLITAQRKLIDLLAEKKQSLISHAVTKGLNPDVPMKDSGVPQVGAVPEHWDVARLKFVAQIQTGIAKGKDVSGRSTVQAPYLRVANVQDGFLDLENIATIDVEANQLERYKLQPGDVLMNEGGDYDKLGRGAVWHGEIDGCIHQNHVFAVRPRAIEPEWITRFAASNSGKFYFMQMSKQSTNLASISSSNLMELPISVPPEKERTEILNWLSREISKLEKLQTRTTAAIDFLVERRSALISAAVTGKIDVRDLVQAPQEQQAMESA